MNLTIFESYVKNSEMEWECAQCDMSNISNLIFDSTISSSTESEEIRPKTQVRSLRIVTLTFQSMFIKTDEIFHFLKDSNIDIILDCKTHLSPSISTSELLFTPYDVNLSEFHLNSDLKKYLIGLNNRKYLSILIFLSRLKKLYFQEKLLKHLILQ